MGQTQPTMADRTSSIISMQSDKREFMDVNGDMNQEEGIGCCVVMPSVFSKKNVRMSFRLDLNKIVEGGLEETYN